MGRGRGGGAGWLREDSAASCLTGALFAFRWGRVACPCQSCCHCREKRHTHTISPRGNRPKTGSTEEAFLRPWRPRSAGAGRLGSLWVTPAQVARGHSPFLFSVSINNVNAHFSPDMLHRFAVRSPFVRQPSLPVPGRTGSQTLQRHSVLQEAGGGSLLLTAQGECDLLLMYSYSYQTRLLWMLSPFHGCHGNHSDSEHHQHKRFYPSWNL